MATNLGQNASNKTSRSVAHCVRHQSQKTKKNTNFLGPWAMFISRERKPKSRQIPPTPTMDMLGVHCSDPPLPDEFEDLIRSSSDPQMHPQRRWHCFFQAFLTSLRISYDPQAILKCILKGVYIAFLKSLRISYDPQAILKCILKGGCIGFSKHF